mmetsp:Transcript_4120/g.3990  ORF Transcript_4120/g.3990 Transcript_4120/m.3990 type:complete len:448 (-) Transcript_4120:226-1569(-)
MQILLQELIHLVLLMLEDVDLEVVSDALVEEEAEVLLELLQRYPPLLPMPTFLIFINELGDAELDLSGEDAEDVVVDVGGEGADQFLLRLLQALTDILNFVLFLGREGVHVDEVLVAVLDVGPESVGHEELQIHLLVLDLLMEHLVDKLDPQGDLIHNFLVILFKRQIVGTLVEPELAVFPSEGVVDKHLELGDELGDHPDDLLDPHVHPLHHNFFLHHLLGVLLQIISDVIGVVVDVREGDRDDAVGTSENLPELLELGKLDAIVNIHKEDRIDAFFLRLNVEGNPVSIVVLVFVETRELHILQVVAPMDQRFWNFHDHLPQLVACRHLTFHVLIVELILDAFYELFLVGEGEGVLDVLEDAGVLVVLGDLPAEEYLLQLNEILVIKEIDVPSCLLEQIWLWLLFLVEDGWDLAFDGGRDVAEGGEHGVDVADLHVDGLVDEGGLP